MKNKERILEISKSGKLSHIGSCLTAVDIIEEIYKSKKPKDRFILSSGHAHLAHSVIAGLKPGVHCDRELGCDVSTGSLGQGLPIALGIALADRSKNVWCLISDGECAEGSIWEALRIKNDLNVDNLWVFVNINGWSAYDAVDKEKLIIRLMAFCPSVIIRHTKVDEETLDKYPQLKDLGGHYKTI